MKVMRKKREYKGCEMECPLYLKVAKEMALERKDKTDPYSYSPKRGKYSAKNSIRNTSSTY